MRIGTLFGDIQVVGFTVKASHLLQKSVPLFGVSCHHGFSLVEAALERQTLGRLAYHQQCVQNLLGLREKFLRLLVYLAWRFGRPRPEHVRKELDRRAAAKIGELLE